MWDYLVKMLQEIVNGIAERCKVVLHNVPDKFIVNVKITVGYVVSHTLHSLPWDLWAG